MPFILLSRILHRAKPREYAENQAIRDPLTSLFNRRYFEDEVNRRIAQAQTTHAQYSVLMIDADHFKRVNDTYGHKTGDKVLIELSSTAERSLRQDDIVARYGGEEFVVFLPELSAEEAKVVADRLRETISKIVVYSDQGEQVTFTVSIGISSSAISDNIDMLIKTSDEALYRAKENGRNRCEIFTVDDLKTLTPPLNIKTTAPITTRFSIRKTRRKFHCWTALTPIIFLTARRRLKRQHRRPRHLRLKHRFRLPAMLPRHRSGMPTLLPNRCRKLRLLRPMKS